MILNQTQLQTVPKTTTDTPFVFIDNQLNMCACAQYFRPISFSIYKNIAQK